MLDPGDVVALARTLIDIDSTTGREGDLATWLAGFLRHAGYEVTEQPVDGDSTQPDRPARPAGRGLLDAPRLRPAVLLQP